MKNIAILMICLVLSTLATAQVDRSKLPEPGPAPEIKLGDAATFTLDNGLKVFVVQNNKLPRVAFSLVLERDPILEGEKAGMTGFVGEMLTAGTKNRSKEALDEEVDFIGASLNAGSTSIYGSSLKKHQEKILELMTDVLYNPIFPDSELDKLKKQTITGLAASKDNPDAISNRLVSSLNFGRNHPYGELETEATVNNVTVEDIKNYYETYFKPNIAYLAIVGDIDKKEAEKLVKKYFTKWEKGQVPSKSYEMPTPPEGNKVAVVDRASSVQSVINLTYPMEMSLANEDYLSTRVLNYILGGGSSSRLFMNLREGKGYTYGAYSSIGSDKLVTSFSANASVRTEVTDSALHEFIYEIDKMVKEGVTEQELEAAKANLSGSFGRSLENPSTIANFAINTERYQLPKDFYATYLQRLSDLSVEDINAVAKKYLKPENMHITVVGDGSGLKGKLDSFGPVAFYDNQGDPARELAEVDADLSAEQVIENYINAIGGWDAAKAIKTAKVNLTADIQGQVLTQDFTFDVDNEKFNQKVSMMGNTLSNVTIADGKAVMTMQGQTQALPEEQFQAAKMNMFLIPELHYKDLAYEMELDGIRDVEGEDAYKVIVTNPVGGKTVNYYSVESGLKVKNENAQSGDTFYNKYDTFSGVKYPIEMTVVSPMIPMPLQAKVNSLDVNVSLTEADFE
ncbi:M16 family metallopeptidase [Pararhodonellum marinum]|uniref:M16 family metallopeptidase n=1 Tax=Pararhodonellum marinum TaxID=2755358 RepID=UPI0018905241|nr:pitrilysin family protein [Pararhodonellum marinum]